MANDEHVALLRQGASVWNDWRSQEEARYRRNAEPHGPSVILKGFFDPSDLTAVQIDRALASPPPHWGLQQGGPSEFRAGGSGLIDSILPKGKFI